MRAQYLLARDAYVAAARRHLLADVAELWCRRISEANSFRQRILSFHRRSNLPVLQPTVRSRFLEFDQTLALVNR